MKYLFLPCLLFIQQLNAQNVELLSTHLDQFQNVRDFAYRKIKVRLISPFIQSPNQDLSQIVCVKTANGGNPDLLPFVMAILTWNPSSQPMEPNFIFHPTDPKMAPQKSR